MPFQQPLLATDIIDLVGDGVISTDSSGRIILSNRAAQSMFGYGSDELLGRDIGDLLPSRFRDDHARHVREFGQESSQDRRPMAHRRAVSGLRKNGEEFPAEATLSRQQMGSRTVMTVVVRDISDRRALEQEAKRREVALEASERRLRLALKSVGMGTWDWNLQADTVSWDEAQARLWGMPGAAVVSPREASERVYVSDRAEFIRSRDAALQKGHWEHEFRLVAPDGSIRWLAIAGDVLRDIPGEPARMIGVTFDISDRREAEEHRQLLTAEMRHRLQNLMSVLQAIVNLSGEQEGSVESYRRSLLGRLRAVAESQRLLFDDQVEDSLSELLTSELAQYENADGSNILLHGPPVRVPHHLAVSLALAVHELATNAAKYGALTLPTGKVEVVWELLSAGSDARLNLTWRERGGPQVSPPTRRGFGASVLERTLGKQPGASVRMDYKPTGLCCAVSLPLGSPSGG